MSGDQFPFWDPEEEAEDPVRFSRPASSDWSQEFSPPPRFCGRCGTPLQSGSSPCPRCADVSVTTLQRTEDSEHTGGAGPLTSALVLYFVLLGTLLATAMMSEHVETMMGVQIADSLIVLAWCVGHGRCVGRMLTASFSPVWLFLPVALGFLTFAIATIIVKGCVALFGIEEIWISTEFLASGYGWGTIILFGCIQPAVIEELAFRGVIQSGLATVLSIREAVIVSACAFAIIHLAFAAIPHLFLLGAVAGYLCVKTKSIYPAMILHFTHNLLCIGMEAAGG